MENERMNLGCKLDSQTMTMANMQVVSSTSDFILARRLFHSPAAEFPS